MDHRLARLRFRDLQALVVIAQLGSLRRAARVVGVSQPALGKMLSEIEDALGRALFERSRAGLSVTPFGRSVLPGAEALLAEFAGFQKAARTSRSPSLRLGCTPFLAQVFLPRWLAALDTDNIEVREGAVPLLLNDLARGRVDAVLGLYPDADSANSSFVHKLVRKEPLHVVAGQSFPTGGSWRALADAPWVLPPKVSVIRRVIDACFVKEGLSPPIPKIESMNMATNLRLARAGVGVTAIAQSYLFEERNGGRLRVVRTKSPPEVPISLVVRRGWEAHGRIKVASDMLFKALRK